MSALRESAFHRAHHLADGDTISISWRNPDYGSNSDDYPADGFTGCFAIGYR
ncbi:MAG: hypothetical protein ABI725_04425 [Chloroflexota bacterium]